MIRTSRTNARRRGFTLVELMVSLLAGSLVIAAAWRMSATSSQLFNRVQRRSEMGLTLRRASALLRRDLTRAGYLSIRDVVEMPNCGGATVSPINQPGIEVRVDGTDQVLYVTGNLTSSDQYPSEGLTNANQVTLNTTNDEFSFSFVNPVNGQFQTNEFLSAFVPNPAQPLVQQGRYISITKGNNVFLRDLVSVQVTPGSAPVLTFAPALPMGSGGTACFSNGDVVLVAPVATYQYRIERSPVAGLTRLSNTDALSGTPDRRLLIRREVMMSTRNAAQPTVVPNSEYVVLDYAEDFRIGAAWDTTPQTEPVGVPVLAYVNNPETLAAQWMIRSVVVDMRVRPPGERRGAGAGDDLLRQMASNEARRSTHFEVNLPNMARRAGASP